MKISFPCFTKHTLNFASIVAVDLQPQAPPLFLNTVDIFSVPYQRLITNENSLWLARREVHVLGILMHVLYLVLS